jgi:hypothetical protein
MRLKFSETGLVEGGIECTFIGGAFGKSIGYEDEAVIDLHEWITAHVSGLVVAAKKLYKSGEQEKGETVCGRFCIGTKEHAFATLYVTPSKTQVFYNHPEYTREHGGKAQPIDFRSSKIQEIADDIIRKASKVKDLNW